MHPHPLLLFNSCTPHSQLQPASAFSYWVPSIGFRIGLVVLFLQEACPAFYLYLLSNASVSEHRVLCMA